MNMTFINIYKYLVRMKQGAFTRRTFEDNTKDMENI
jgi:hypothetical protein